MHGKQKETLHAEYKLHSFVFPQIEFSSVSDSKRIPSFLSVAQTKITHEEICDFSCI